MNSVVSICGSEYFVAAVSGRKYFIIFFSLGVSSASRWIFAEITFYLQRI